MFQTITIYHLLIKSFIVLTLLFYCYGSNVLAQHDSRSTPVISIIIDDIGYRLREDIRAIAIPGPIAFAIMPHSPHAEKMSQLVRQQNRDVIVHMPMEAVEEKKNRFLGPGALTLDMTVEEFKATLNDNLLSIPSAIGINNHMGSLLTRHPGHMEWLMESLKQHGKFYLDSVTSSQSVARMMARENSVPYLKRDVFLDNQQNTHYIDKQFEELIKIAIKNGKAIAIGHPHPETIEVLTKKIPELQREGIRLISIQDMVNNRYKSLEPTKMVENTFTY